MAESAESKSWEIVPANARRETDVGCEVSRIAQVPTMEVAEASNNKRVAEARRARVEWLEKLRAECTSEEEFQTARSQPTWTELDSSSSSSCSPDDSSPAKLERIREDNRRHFQQLLDTQSPSDVRYFHRLGDEKRPFYVDFGERLEVGKKIGGGGQATIHEAIFDGEVSKWFVLKVFGINHHLADLQRLWMKNIAKLFDNVGAFSGSCCFVQNGTLLQDGRFAFLLRRYWGDLRKFIDLEIVKDKTHCNPPFPHFIVLTILVSIASGMEALHERGILHRDLKAANCLLPYSPTPGTHRAYYQGYTVADFDSPHGVVGTRFWRAPEVLLALKNKVVDLHSNREIWTEKADVYSYAMTCYEVLTGCIPFDERATNDCDNIIDGERPLLPDYVNPKLQELVKRCWHPKPSMRPTFIEIVRELTTSQMYFETSN